MDYFKPFSADTQAAFFSAEAEMIRFGERASQLPHAEYLKNTLLAIDAVFAIRMAHDIALPPVPRDCSFRRRGLEVRQRRRAMPRIDAVDATVA